MAQLIKNTRRFPPTPIWYAARTEWMNGDAHAGGLGKWQLKTKALPAPSPLTLLHAMATAPNRIRTDVPILVSFQADAQHRAQRLRASKPARIDDIGVAQK